jgi:hypothetical protein
MEKGTDDMSSEREILIKLNDILSKIANTLYAVGASKMLTLDRATLADAAQVYFRENGEERFRVGMSCGEMTSRSSTARTARRSPMMTGYASTARRGR